MSDHPRSSVSSLLILPRSSSLSVMSHSPPTHHKISKHVFPHRITQYGLIQLKCAKFKFKLERVNYLCKQDTNNLVSHPLFTIAKCLIRSICHRVANPYRYMPSTAGVAAGSRSFFFSRGVLCPAGSGGLLCFCSGFLRYAPSRRCLFFSLLLAVGLRPCCTIFSSSSGLCLSNLGLSSFLCFCWSFQLRLIPVAELCLFFSS
jgi:hypothetical protein